MATGRQRQKEETREKILETAFRLYQERGFDTATGVIAAEAGVSHGTIFAHFPTVDGLLACIIEAFGRDVSTDIHDLVEGCGSVEQVLDAHIRGLARREVFYRRLITERHRLPPEAETALVTIHSGFSHHLGLALAREREAGLVKDLDPAMVFNTWMGLVHYYLQNRHLFTREETLLPRYRAQLVESFMALLRRAE